MPTEPPRWSAADGGGPPPMPPPYQPPPGHQPGFAGPPGYGWGPPGAAPLPWGYPPYRIGRPAPRKFWYGIGALLIALAAVVGLVVAIEGVHIMSKQPSSDHTFSSGASTTVHIDPGATKVIFMANWDTGAEHRIHCDVSPTAGVELTRYTGELTLNQWTAFFRLTVSQAGDYTVSCMGSPSDTFGVGDDLRISGLIGAIVGGIASLGLLSLGVVTLVVTAVLRRRRAGHR